jgi:hypothetical protein
MEHFSRFTLGLMSATIILVGVSGYYLGKDIRQEDKIVVLERVEYVPMYPEIVYLSREIKYTQMEVPKVPYTFMSFMDRSKITKLDSLQYTYRLLAEPQDSGLLKYLDCYMVAMGTYYGALGTEFRVTLDTGIVLNVIKTEHKANQHTDFRNMYTLADKSIIEFVVDRDKLPADIRASGNINKIFVGNIVSIERRETRRK